MGLHVVLTGLMGVGKSTTADVVAAKLGRPHRDSDRDIEALFGITGAQLAAERGVDELHLMESAVLLGALAASEPMVISAAGWVVEDPNCVAAMARRSTVVVLDASVDEIVNRAATGDHRRPIAPQDVAAIADRRAHLFDRVAGLRLDATEPTEQLVAAIIRFLDEHPPR
ncbi:MAG: shikimate kinase [Acidimicrobiales bacterium]